MLLGMIQNEVIRVKSFTQHIFILSTTRYHDSRDWDESSEVNRQKPLSSWSLRSRRLRGKKSKISIVLDSNEG